MSEKPTNHVEVIQGQPNLESANRLVANLTRALMISEDFGAVLNEAGFTSKELVATLDSFLYGSALTGSGQSGIDPQIRTINQFRGLLKPFLPKEEDIENDGVMRAKSKSGKDRSGRQWRAGGWNQEE